jgi:hypothetical protein
MNSENCSNHLYVYLCRMLCFFGAQLPDCIAIYTKTIYMISFLVFVRRPTLNVVKITVVFVFLDFVRSKKN